jgi:hypothetical protein
MTRSHGPLPAVAVLLFVGSGLMAPAARAAARAADELSSSPQTASSQLTSSQPAEATQAAEGPAFPLPTLRTPLPVLQERFVGVASRATRFDWRSTTAMVGVFASELIERNNFAAVRLGLLGRRALGDLVIEGGVSWAASFATSSSDLIALTPYRQAGRPARLELEANVAYPLAEGVTTASAWFVPPAELVLNVIGGARYLLYPQLFFSERPPSDIPFGLGTAASIVSPVLTDEDVVILERDATPSMAIDRARLQVLLGVGTDVYFQPGIFFAPRALVAIPVLAPLSSTSLGFFWEVTALVGFAW